MEFKIHYLPVIISIAFPASLAITFFLSNFYYDDHVTYVLPYISDTGTFPPESCIFGQTLNVMSIIVFFVVYIKYRQIEEILDKRGMKELENINKMSLNAGLLATIGMSIVANFQEMDMIVVHWIGAILVFGFGAIYQCVQTLIYIKITPIIGQRKLTIFRIILAVTSMITFLIFVISGFVAYAQFEGEDYTKWKVSDGGYNTHQTSTITEWICATCTLMYISLLYFEFKNITINRPGISVKEVKFMEGPNL